jgi:hypothetical protein
MSKPPTTFKSNFDDYCKWEIEDNLVVTKYIVEKIGDLTLITANYSVVVNYLIIVKRTKALFKLNYSFLLKTRYDCTLNKSNISTNHQNYKEKASTLLIASFSSDALLIDFT